MTRNTKIVSLMAIVLITISIAIYSIALEPYWVEVTKHTLVSNLVRRVEIAHVSDLHTNNIGAREKRILRIIDQEKPDLIAVTGDLVNGENSYKSAIQFLEKLNAPLGVWWVRGNWENWHPPSVPLRQLASNGATFLNNESRAIKENFWIVGLDDLSSGIPDLTRAFQNVPKDAFTLILSHSPALFDELPKERCHLVLSGHTHGGQIRLPIFGPLWLPEGSGKYVNGWYKKEGCQMYVSRGIGTSILPVRFLSRPEIAFITLESRTNESENE